MSAWWDAVEAYALRVALCVAAPLTALLVFDPTGAFFTAAAVFDPTEAFFAEDVLLDRGVGVALPPVYGSFFVWVVGFAVCPCGTFNTMFFFSYCAINKSPFFL
jgi:hypothetical protein